MSDAPAHTVLAFCAAREIVGAATVEIATVEIATVEIATVDGAPVDGAPPVVTVAELHRLLQARFSPRAIGLVMAVLVGAVGVRVLWQMG